MKTRNRRPVDFFIIYSAAFVFVSVFLFSFPGQAAHTGNEMEKTRLLMPLMSAEKGKDVFVDKGCVSCHAINGVGGHDAPALDAHASLGAINPFDFAAKMWNHAPGMIAAQEEAFGEHITFTGDDLANIIAFVHDDDVQHTFTESSLTDKARKMMDHGHGPKNGTSSHAEETGHGHAPGTPAHKD